MAQATTDGLTIEFNESTNEISFSWCADTHPQWNALKTVSKQYLIDLITKSVSEDQAIAPNTQVKSGNND